MKGLTLSDSKSSDNYKVIKIGWCWYKQNIDQWNSIVDTETDSHIQNQLIYEKGVTAV